MKRGVSLGGEGSLFTVHRFHDFLSRIHLTVDRTDCKAKLGKRRLHDELEGFCLGPVLVYLSIGTE